MNKDLPEDEPFFLYILMRTDLASMNPGKAVAHGAHAANQFDAAMKHVSDPMLLAGYEDWINSAGFFGTTFTLSVNEATLFAAVNGCASLGSMVTAGTVFDPTYPLRDGAFCHFIPLTTCGYVFGQKSLLNQFLGNLELMA